MLKNTKKPLTDIYHRLLIQSWTRFLTILVVAYLLSNVLFGFLYWLDPGGIENSRPGSFVDSFAFSIQTMATIGYGKFCPCDWYTHLLVTVQSVCGLMWNAIITGLIFSKFALPISRIEFSRAVITGSSLVIRIVNERNSFVGEAIIRVTLFQNDKGEKVRKFFDLPVQRLPPVITSTWTATHHITEDSVLFGKSYRSLKEADAEILVTFVGLDDTFAQTVYARHTYRVKDILFRSNHGTHSRD